MNQLMATPMGSPFSAGRAAALTAGTGDQSGANPQITINSNDPNLVGEVVADRLRRR